MAEALIKVTFEQGALSENALTDVVKQLRQHPAVRQIINAIVTEGLESSFKYVPEKTVSSFLGRGEHHYKSCAKGSEDGLLDIQSSIYTTMIMMFI
jgi:hypothetical protein